MENQEAVFSGNFSSGSGNSSNPPRNLRTRFDTYITDCPPGFEFGPMTGVSARSGQREEANDAWKEDFHRRRRVGAVRSKVGEGGQCDEGMMEEGLDRDEGEKLVLDDQQVGNNDEGERSKVLELLALFRKRCEEISKDGDTRRVDAKAYNELVGEGKISKGKPSLFGPVPGIEVGDKFKCRAELVMVGLHRHWINGIDYVKDVNGEPLATCVVTNESYSDKMANPDTILYIGEGGNIHSRDCSKPKVNDQKLTNGNLALWRCKKMKCPVRVIKGYRPRDYDNNQRRWVERREYVYDGLFDVSDCVEKEGESQNLFFEFTLRR